MGDPSKTRAGYSLILERVLKHYDAKKGPRAPYIILDADSTIRYASESVVHLVQYTPDELTGQPFLRFLSWDQYTAALRIVAHRADHVASGRDRATLQQWYAHLEDEIENVRRLFSPPGKVASVNAQIKAFLRGREEKERIPSKVRIQEKSGETMVLDDELTLYRHPDGGYAGAFVTLRQAPKKSRWKSYLWANKQDAYPITTQYVLPVFSLRDKTAIQRSLSELVRETMTRPKEEPLVIDLGMVEDVDADAMRALLSLVADRTEAGTVKIGNAPEGVEAVVQEYLQKKLPGLCCPLDYKPVIEVTSPDTPRELTTHEDLERYISAKLNNMEEKIRANTVPE